MKKRTKLILFMAVLFSFIVNSSGCGFFVAGNIQREYHEDIHIPLDTQQAEIVIKEWSFLSGSGAEVYYKDADKEMLLGNLLGGDDGFCPFKEGLYAVAVGDNKLTIEWCRFPTSGRESWEKEVFELPSG